MGSKTIIAYFSNNGSPATGLSPTVRIRDVSDGSLVVTDAAMTEVGDGFYKYLFSSYNITKAYVIRADGTATLANTDRYVVMSNENVDLEKGMKISENRLKIENNQLKIYDDDDTTVLYTYDLKDQDGNPSVASIFQRNPV